MLRSMVDRFLGRQESTMGKLTRLATRGELPDIQLTPISGTIDPIIARLALEQVTQRLDAQLIIKNSTEQRAMAVASHCMLMELTIAITTTALSFVDKLRPGLLAAATTGGCCLVIAILFAYRSVRTRHHYLPGRLPIEIWPDLFERSGIAEFISQLMVAAQNIMIANERSQQVRTHRLNVAMVFVQIAIPVAILNATITWAIGVWFFAR